MHGKGVPEIVNPRPLSPAPVRDPALPKKLAECAIKSLRGQRSAVGSGKEQIVRSLTAGMGSQVASQSGGEGWCNRNEAILAELPFAYGQKAAHQIDIPDLQVPKLAYPQSASVEQPEDQWEHDFPPRRVATGAYLIGRGQEVTHLLLGENVGDER
jgi:hypothetical protein